MSTEVKIPKLLTTRQLAEVTGLPLWSVRKLVKKGEGPPAVKVAGRLRFPESGVGPWIQRLLEKPALAAALSPLIPTTRW